MLFTYFVISFLNSYIRDIKKFLNQTKEIVFLNIHRFSPETERSAKDSSGHQRLKKQLLAMFEKQMVTYSKPYNRKTFGECWKADHRIFVSYNHRSYDKLLGDKLWPGIQVNHDLFQYWDVCNEYYKDNLCNRCIYLISFLFHISELLELIKSKRITIILLFNNKYQRHQKHAFKKYLKAHCADGSPKFCRKTGYMGCV